MSCTIHVCVKDGCTGLPIHDAHIQADSTGSGPCFDPNPAYRNRTWTQTGGFGSPIFIKTGADGCANFSYAGKCTTLHVSGPIDQGNGYYYPLPVEQTILLPDCSDPGGGTYSYTFYFRRYVPPPGGVGGASIVPCTCPPGTVYNPTWNICQGPCDPCQHWDNSHGICSTDAILCVDGHVLDANTCTCVCPPGTIECNGLCITKPVKPVCYNERHCYWDSVLCKYVCPGALPPDCADYRSCTWVDAICDWCCLYNNGVPPNNGCPSGYTWDNTANDCVAPSTPVCPTGYTWDIGSANCMDGMGGLLCAGGTWYDPSVGSCVPGSWPSGSKCPAGETWDDKCQQCTLYPACPSGKYWDPSTCSCKNTCPTGTQLCNGQCVEETLRPDCFSTLHCFWDTTFCGWSCDPIPSCSVGNAWDGGTCACEPESFFGLDTSLNHWNNKKFVFRRGGVGDHGLYIDTYNYDNASVPPWVISSTDLVIPFGDSPSIIKQRNGSLSIAYYNGTNNRVETAQWDHARGRLYVQQVALANAVDHVQDKWGRTVFMVYNLDWYVVVGVLKPDGKGYNLSAPVKMVDKVGNPMHGRTETQASLINLPDGSLMFTYINTSKATKAVVCRSLNNDGTGSWN